VRAGDRTTSGRARAATAVLLGTVALAVGACGSNHDPENPSGQGAGAGNSNQMVAAADVARVIQARGAIGAACRAKTPRRVPASAVSTLVDVYRAGPTAIFRFGSGSRELSMDTLLRAERDRLRACGASRQAATLDRALASD
jgi:hypothetical protein